jgi:fatty-acyl-CoA synthase
MMEYPLLLSHLFNRGRKLFVKKQIASRSHEGIFRYTYADFAERVLRLMGALKGMGVKEGDVVGTFAWNDFRHLELYFAVPMLGAILHTINIRLFPDQLAYIINHAEDKVIFVGDDLLPLLKPFIDKLPNVERFVILADKEKAVPEDLEGALNYETLLKTAGPIEPRQDLSEWTPCGLCYTTATTGNPKGVLYTHRGLFLHSMATGMADSAGLSESDVVMPVVPMFHVNAWGIPFAAVGIGAKIVLPGPRPTPKDLVELIEAERVTTVAGLPTVWVGMADALLNERHDVSSLRIVVNGGAAIPKALIKTFEKKIGVPIMQGYGMTETSPIVTVGWIKSGLRELPYDELLNIKAKQGLPLFGVDFRVVGPDGREIVWNGKEIGELQFRGPWIAKEYFKDPEMTKASFTADGWFRTQDIVTVDEEAYILIVDRERDLIKSGGEWVSSLDLENTLMAHPKVAEACIIGVPDEKWGECPVAYIVARKGFQGSLTKEELASFLKERVASFWIPSAFYFVSEIPKTSVGKFSKRILRDRYLSGTV